MEPLSLPVLLGTTRDGARTPHVARYVTARLSKRPGVVTRLYDPRELPFENLRRREWEMTPQPAEVAAFVADMARADGFVLVFPEYNHGYPGALKNVLDHLYDEWHDKPFALVSTGGISGGMRASHAVRDIVSGGLKGVPVPTSVPVPYVAKAFGPDGPLDREEDWARRFDKLFGDLERYARAMRGMREEGARGG